MNLCSQAQNIFRFLLCQRIFSILLVFLCCHTSVSAQVILGDPPQMPSDLVGLSRPPLRIAAQGLEVNTQNREEVRNFYNTVFQASEHVPAQWTGNVDTCSPGSVSQAYQDATLLRVNYYRAMAGVPAAITFDSVYNAKAQQAALMMLANDDLDHHPPTSWNCYTAEGAEAAKNSNLSLGHSGPDAVQGQVRDDGDNNAAAGHRRWILYPQTQLMGAGSVQTDTWRGANSLWVHDSNMWGTRPTVRDDFVSWPPKGYVPYPLVYNRWSFSYPGADFSNTSVTMQNQGQAISLTKEPISNGYGENTLVWIPAISLGTAPASDLSYDVTLQNVIVQGVARSFSYTVTAIDPAKYGADTVLPAISGSAEPVVNQANAYTLTTVPGATGYEWQSASLTDFTQTEGAEMGLGSFIADTASDYNVTVTDVKASGNAGFHLAHTTPNAQILTFKSQFFVNNGAQLQFASRLTLATSSQHARIELSTDDGQSWQAIFEQAGTDSSGESSFGNKTVSLANFVNKTIQIRFAYLYTMDGQYYYQSSNDVGWYFDDIRFTGLSELSNISKTRISSPSFSLAPSQTTRYLLQARAVVYDKYPLEWGDGTVVNAVNTGGTTQALNLSLIGSGSVISNPAGIDCGADCSESYASGTIVTLTATPASDTIFSGWSGDCTGTQTTCTVTLNSALSTTATFTPLVSDVSDYTAEMTATPLQGNAPLLVDFSMKNTNMPTNCVFSPCLFFNWDFGDGTTSKEAKPSHTYTQPGTYTARLTISNQSGDKKAETQTVITVTAVPTQSDKTRISIMGDSITLGVNNCVTYGTQASPYCTIDEQVPHSYRFFLWNKIQGANWNVDFVGHTASIHTQTFDQDVDAASGKRISGLLPYASGWTMPPDIVLIYLGAQNLFDGQPVAAAVDEMNALIDQLRITNPNMVIFVAQPYPMTAIPGMPTLSTWQAFNTELAALAQRKNTEQSPVIAVDHSIGFDQTSDLLNDKVHPNIKGEEKMAQKWFDAMQTSSAVQTLLGNNSQVSQYSLTVTKTGSGTISSAPDGIACGTDCNETYMADTQVTLTAYPEIGHTFSGWGGDCTNDVTTPNSPSLNTTVTLNSAKTCSATFISASTPPHSDPICLVQPIGCGATVALTATPTSGVSPLTVSLQASLVTNLGISPNSITYSWTVNGQTAAGDNTSLTLTNPGMHRITVTATDANGYTATAQTEITVTLPQVATRFSIPEAVYAGTTSLLPNHTPMDFSYPAEVYTGQKNSVFQQYLVVALRDSQDLLFHDAKDNSVTLINWNQNTPLNINGVQTTAAQIGQLLVAGEQSSLETATLNGRISGLENQLAEKEVTVGNLNAEITQLKNDNLHLRQQLDEMTIATANCPSITGTVNYALIAGQEAAAIIDAQTSITHATGTFDTFWKDTATQCKGEMSVILTDGYSGFSRVSLELPTTAAYIYEFSGMYRGLGTSYTLSGGLSCGDGKYLHLKGGINGNKAQINFAVVQPGMAQQQGIELQITPTGILSAVGYTYTP